EVVFGEDAPKKEEANQERKFKQWCHGKGEVARPEPVRVASVPMRRKGEALRNMNEGHAGSGQGDAEKQEMEAGDEAGHRQANSGECHWRNVKRAGFPTLSIFENNPSLSA